MDDPDTDIFADDFGVNCNSVPKTLVTPFLASGTNRHAEATWRTQRVGSQIVLTYRIDNLAELSGFGVAIDYDARAVELADVEGLGELFSARGEKSNLSVTSSEQGRFMAASALKRGYETVNGSGQLLKMYFNVLNEARDSTPVRVSEVVLADANRGVDRIVNDGAAVEPVPDEVSLTALPNPSNPNTTIQFTIPVASRLSIDIYDILGQRVETVLADALKGAGTHTAAWNGRDESGQLAASGTYFIWMRVGDQVYNKKITLLR